MEIKEVLYKEIDKIGKNNIRSQLSSNINDSKTIINLLLKNCQDFLNISNPYEDEFVLFGEALLHFILTMSMIPAERKIKVDDIDVDILVPNSKNLKIDSNKAILIYFLKDKNVNINESFEKLSAIQKNINNIWIVTSSSSFLKDVSFRVPMFVISSTFFNSYISDNNSIYSFSEIVIKIDEFLKKINYSGLKIF